MNVEIAAKAAYEACPDQPHKRIPWETLTEVWRDYWRQIARGVLGALQAG